MSRNKSLQKNIANNSLIANTKTPDKLEIGSIVNSIICKFTNDQNKLMDKIQESSKKLSCNPKNKNLLAQFTKDLEAYSEITAVENGLYLKSNIHKLDQKYAVLLRQNLIDEYEASSHSELAIIDLAVSSYFRALRSSSLYSALVQNEEGVVSWRDQQKINLIKEIGKQIEIANRQFLTATTYLKEFRQQPLNIKVQTKSAFIAQNQQFNNNA